jgi:hypothetical protein
MYDEPVHICLGACRYPDFKPGDPVALSDHGWDQGLAVNYAYTIGEVVKFENGLLTVQREGAPHPQDFHPCFWAQSTKEDIEAVRKMEEQEYWNDHVPATNDDLHFKNEE